MKGRAVRLYEWQGYPSGPDLSAVWRVHLRFYHNYFTANFGHPSGGVTLRGRTHPPRYALILCFQLTLSGASRLGIPATFSLFKSGASCLGDTRYKVQPNFLLLHA